MWKRIFKSFALLYLPILALSFLFFYTQKNNQIEELSLIQERAAANKKNLFIDLCSSILHDLSYWTNINYPIDFQPTGKHKELMVPYLDLIEGIRDYDQFRFLDLKGQEFFRAEQIGRKTISKDTLQDKSQRNYVKKGLSLKPGQVYLSQIDFNKEYGVVEQPYKPVIRAVAPIYDTSDNKIGIVVINFKMKRILDQLKGKINYENFFLLDADRHIISTNVIEEDLPYERVVLGDLEKSRLPTLPSKEHLISKDTTFLLNNSLWSITNLDLNNQQTIVSPFSYDLMEIITPTKWLIALEIPKEIFFANLRPIITGLLVFNFFAVLLFLITTYLYHRFQIQKELFYSELENKNERLTYKRNKLAEQNIKIADINKRLEVRNNQLNRFNYVVSHNLRAPVTSMSVIINMLKNEKDTEERTDLLLKLEKVSKSIVGLTEDIGEYISILDKKEITVNYVDVNEVIDKVKHEFTETLLDNSNFKVIIKTDAWNRVSFSKFYLQSIIQNLISNAIKYRRGDIDSFICFETTYEDNKKVMYVRDNGIGIDLKKHGDNLFGLYKRFHRNVSGKGMGLFLVKSQLEALDAVISVKSEENIGTTFKITF